MICISVAHSSKSRGAINQTHDVNEYDLSKQASYSCFEIITKHGYPCMIVDCGGINDTEYSIYKPKVINSLSPQPDLALEIHLNSSLDKEINYGEVIYGDSSRSYIPKSAADSICGYLKDGFSNRINNISYKDKGPVLDERGLFFIKKINCPSIIVEGLFISNNEHAEWLKHGGASTYGSLVGMGIVNWLKKVE